MWLIRFQKPDSSSILSTFRHSNNDVVDFACDEASINEKLDELVQDAKVQLTKNVRWIKDYPSDKIFTEKSTINEKGNHNRELSVNFPFLGEDKVETITFTSHPLDGSCRSRDLSKPQLIKDMLSAMGFGAEIALLLNKHPSAEKLSSLLFIQYQEGVTDWRATVREGLEKLRNEIEIWGAEFSHYCKYRDMGSQDRYVGLSLDIAGANAKLLRATAHDRGDPIDEIHEGSATEPARLSLFPNGGSYVLTAEVDQLKESESYRIEELLKKCPVAEITDIFKRVGLEEEIMAVPAKHLKAKTLTNAFMGIVRNDIPAARNELVRVGTLSTETVSRKRKAEK